VIAAAGLLVYAGLLLAAAAPGLARARWPDRAPRLAVAAWFTVTGSAVASVILGGLALLVPTVRVSTDLARVLTACVMALRSQYAHPGGAALAGVGAVLAVAVAGRVAWCVAATLAQAAWARRQHRLRLRLASRPEPGLGALVVDHPEPAAWCLPGDGTPAVITTGAIDVLGDAQLAAVLAHERAHQRGHHHVLVALAGALAAAFPRVPAFLHAHQQVARLTELLADDAASAASHRLTVAEALLALSAPAPVAALGAGGSSTGARVRRLIADPAPLSRATAAAVTLSVAALLAAPVVMAAGPAAVAAGKQYCLHPRPAAIVLAADHHPGCTGSGCC
jgi:Zn-dependent protease with chaperone function